MDCQRARFTPETTICNDPEMKQADTQIAQLYGYLLNRFFGDDRKIFVAGQEAWQRERNNCRNTPAAEFGCLRDKLEQRVVLLKAIAGDPSKLKDTVASYEFIHPWYLDRFGTDYAGKRVNVFGSMKADICGAARLPLAGRIEYEGSSVNVQFKSLPPIDVTFLCTKMPVAWWSGSVTINDGHPVLYLTEILGRPLP